MPRPPGSSPSTSCMWTPCSSGDCTYQLRGIRAQKALPAAGRPHLRGFPRNTDSVDCDEGAFHRILVFIEHGTRRMHLGGVTANPTGEWTVRQARNLSLTLGERFENVRFLIRDRGSNFTQSFDAVFQANGTRILQTAVQAPRMNATCERLLGTLRRELLDRMLILSQAHLRAVLIEYQVHYNSARPHQGIAQRIPGGDREVPRAQQSTSMASESAENPY